MLVESIQDMKQWVGWDYKDMSALFVLQVRRTGFLVSPYPTTWGILMDGSLKNGVKSLLHLKSQEKRGWCVVYSVQPGQGRAGQGRAGQGQGICYNAIAEW